MPRLFLDLDGVLADYDKAATQVLGGDHYKFEFIHGKDVYWQLLHQSGRFFEDLLPMPDAMTLWYTVRRFKPVILTALPRTNAERTDMQKRSWVREWLGADVEVITCATADKPNYCFPGDILVDDRTINRAPWEAQGGHYVHHTSAAESIAALAELGLL
jgi:hypothetical protein